MKTMVSIFKVVVIFLTLALPSYPAAGEEEGGVTPLQVVVVDVGHGDCIWIRTPDDGIKGNGRCEGYNIIIDGGPSSKRIVPLVTEAGLKYGTPIDWMICTHAHNDHYRGLIGILEQFKVRRVLDPGYRSLGQAYCAFCWTALIEPESSFYSPLIGIAAIPGLKSLSQKVPCELAWGAELDVKVLYSNPAVTDDTINLSSVVIRVSYNLISFLFTGDAEGKYRVDPPTEPMYVEKFLLDQYVNKGQNELKSTILKIGHHGSETSSTTPFIEAVSPKEGIVCAGNRYGLPDESVIKRYEAHGCRVWRTDRLDANKPASECHGDDHIVITTNGIDYRIAYMKEDPAENKVMRRE